MTTPHAGCECAITNEMIWAGPCVSLCHHSTAQEAGEAREKLLDVLGTFAQDIDPREMFDKSIVQMAEDYRKEVAGKLDRFLSRDEYIVININFMRNLSLAAQMIMCTMIIDRNQTG